MRSLQGERLCVICQPNPLTTKSETQANILSRTVVFISRLVLYFYAYLLVHIRQLKWERSTDITEFLSSSIGLGPVAN